MAFYNEMVDFSFSNIKKLVNEMTCQKECELNHKSWKQLKLFCRKSDANIKMVFELLMLSLKKKHSEVRHKVLFITNELFRRSSFFRKMVIDNFTEVSKLTLGFDIDSPLPPPTVASRELKKFACKVFKEWNTSYSESYKKLALGCRYLEQCCHINLSNHVSTDSVRDRVDASLVEIRLKNMKTEMNGKIEDIKKTIMETKSALNLLIPECKDYEGTFDAETSLNTDLRSHGIRPNYSLQVDLNGLFQITVDENNECIFTSLRDSVSLLKKVYYPVLKKWLAIASKAEGDNELLKQIIDFKEETSSLINKFERIKFLNVKHNDNESDSEDDFVEVNFKEGYEEDVCYPPNTTHGTNPKSIETETWKINDIENEDEVGDPSAPTTSLKRRKRIGSVQSNSRYEKRNCLLAVAPKLPFDVDLLHWEDDNLSTPVLASCSNGGLHRFWNSTEDSEGVILDPDGPSAWRKRVIEFTGEWKPVEHTCLAPMPNGLLCPRQDRIKCPFHGIIIKRNESGQAVNPEEEIKAQQSLRKRSKCPEWQEQSLLNDIKAAIGIDLKMPSKGSKKNNSNISDLKKLENNSRKRLSKKIFSKQSMMKTARLMDALDHRKFQDKFGHQWNYSMGTA